MSHVAQSEDAGANLHADEAPWSVLAMAAVSQMGKVARDVGCMPHADWVWAVMRYESRRCRAHICHAQVGAKVLLDCSQSVPGKPTDVRALGADWIVATGHKMCGPTGIGFLWGRWAASALCAALTC